MGLDAIARAAMRPLPRTTSPVRDETLESYLARIAAGNRLDPAALRAYAAGTRRTHAPIDPGTLARLTGQPETTLTAALPDLSTRPADRVTVVGTACPRCTRHDTAAVRRYRHLEDAVCLRHRYWLADETNYTPGPLHLDHAPEILAAARRHRKLLRRHGARRADAAFGSATAICRDWRARREHTEILDRQLRLLQTHYPRDATGDLGLDAGLYPQIIALARLFASPYWSSLPLTGPAGLDRFLSEVRATIAPTYTWCPYPRYRYLDPLVEHVLATADGEGLARQRSDATTNGGERRACGPSEPAHLSDLPRGGVL